MFSEMAVDVWIDRADLFAKQDLNTRISSDRRMRKPTSTLTKSPALIASAPPRNSRLFIFDPRITRIQKRTLLNLFTTSRSSSSSRFFSLRR
jgi:hypothetical protein